MKKTVSFSDLLTIGENFFHSGQRERYLQVMRLGSKLLADLVRSGQMDKALTLEPSFYNKLVKKIESEENYYEGFRQHATVFYEAGLKEADSTISPGDPKKIVFLAHSSVLLGHTEVMLNLLASWKKKGVSIRPYFIGLTSMQQDLGKRLVDLGIVWYAPIEKMNPTELFCWCQAIVKRENISTAVWLSTPCWVSYFFGRKVAYKQVLWSLKFHPVFLGEAITHIGFGRKSDDYLIINQKKWISYSPPLSLDYEKPPQQKIQELKTQFKGKYIFGTLARTEKFNSTDFIDAVSKILKTCPNAIYLYTGRERPQLLEATLKKLGLDGQLLYVGWVDTNLYAAVLDCFLETFPFGCGITSLQALAHDVPVVSMWDQNTVARVYFENQQLANSYTNNFYCYSSVTEYISKAIELYTSSKNEKTQYLFNEIEADMSDRFLEILGVRCHE